jgi:dipeptidyl aminopeptidase/acylaminoacyl peptidase
MPELREVFDMATKQIEPDLDSWREQEERQRGARRKRQLGALVVGAAFGILIVMAVVLVASDRSAAPPATRPGADPEHQNQEDPTVLVPGQVPQGDYLVDPVPETDYLIELDTGEMTPLPQSIAGNGAGEYAASPDGSRVAFTKHPEGEGKGDQIFVADLGGSEVVQVTHDVENADEPAWSPDGSKIAYVGVHDGDLRDVFVVDLATGTSTQLTFATREPDPAAPDFGPWRAWLPSFTSDGLSIVFHADREKTDDVDVTEVETRIVPVAGGTSVRLMDGIYDAVLSPDGLHWAYSCDRGTWPELGPAGICLADADGTDERVLVQGGADSIPTVRWSPDGRWIAYWEFHSNDVSIADVATGAAWHVAEGDHPTWLDDHTLIVGMDDSCYDDATAARGGEGCKG